MTTPRKSASTLLYCGVVPYTSLRQRPHWLADGLARSRRVLYLDPNFSILRRGMQRDRLERPSENLAVLTPAPALPATGIVRRLNRASYALTATALKRSLASLGWAPPEIALVSFPKQIDLLRHLELSRVVYDVMDDYPRFFGPLEARGLAAMHVELLRRADHVSASSHVLAERARAAGAHNVTVLENAVPAEFATACASAARAPELASLPRPIFGYIGVIARWVDMNAVLALARAFPQGTVVLVGPAERRLPPLPDNVRLLGRRPHATLPALLKAFDVGLVPFRRDPLIDAVNPVKVYEYWAAGLRILSTPFAEAERLRPIVTVADVAEWPARARALLSEPVAARPALPTWEARVTALSKLLEIPAGAATPA